MKKELTIGLLTVALTVGLASTVTAQTSQDTNVSVDVSGVTQLDVRPSSLSYSNVAGNDNLNALEPGESRTTSDEGFRHIEVENIGSQRIGDIYAQASMPTTQPFGTDATSVDAPHNTGNFVTMSLDGANNASYNFGSQLSEVEQMHYLNRVEYFEENPPTYIQTESPGNTWEDGAGNTISTDGVSVGRIRVGAADYFFVVYETDTAGPEVVFGNSPHTPTQRGTTDFTNDGSNYQTIDLSSSETSTSGVYQMNSATFVDFDTSDGNYTGQSVIGGDPLASQLSSELETNLSASTRDYNLYFDLNDGFVTRTKFNVQLESPDESYQLEDDAGTGAQEYILNANSESEALQPGSNFPINFGVQLPSGVDSNAIEEGTVTVISNTYS